MKMNSKHWLCIAFILLGHIVFSGFQVDPVEEEPQVDEAAQKIKSRLDLLEIKMDQLRIQGSSSSLETEILNALNKLMEEIKVEYKFSMSEEMEHQFDRARCAKYFVARHEEYLAMRQDYDGIASAYPLFPKEVDRVAENEDLADSILVEAQEYQKSNPKDLSGIRKMFYSATELFGTSSSMKARKEIYGAKSSRRVSARKTREEMAEDRRIRREKLLKERDKRKRKYNRNPKPDVKPEELRKERAGLVQEPLLDAMDDYHKALRTHKFEELQTRLDTMLQASMKDTVKQQKQLSSMCDFVMDADRYFLIAKYGAAVAVAKPMTFDIQLGLSFQGEIVDVGIYDLTIYNYDKDEYQKNYFYDISEKTLHSLIQPIKSTDARRIMFSYFLLNEDVEEAENEISKVSTTESWVVSYKEQLKCMLSVSDLTEKIDVLEKGLKKDEKALEKLKRRFKLLFLATNKDRYDSAMDKVMIPILRMNTDDLTAKAIRGLNEISKQETGFGLNYILKAAMTQCSKCNATRTLKCPNCNGTGKIKRVRKRPGKSDLIDYTTCRICKGTKKIACKECAARVGLKGGFKNYNSFAGHINSILSKAPRRK